MSSPNVQFCHSPPHLHPETEELRIQAGRGQDQSSLTGFRTGLGATVTHRKGRGKHSGQGRACSTRRPAVKDPQNFASLAQNPEATKEKTGRFKCMKSKLFL